jgi:hypothetical protein
LLAVLSALAIGASAPPQPVIDKYGNETLDAGVNALAFCIFGADPPLCFSADGGSLGAGCAVVAGKFFCPSTQFDGGIEAQAVDGGAEVYGAVLCNAGGCFASVPVTSACDSNGYCYPQMSTPFADAGQLQTSLMNSRPGMTLMITLNSNDTAPGMVINAATFMTIHNLLELKENGNFLFGVDGFGNNVFDGGSIFSDLAGWIGPFDGGGFPVNGLYFASAWWPDAGGGPPGPLFNFSPVVAGGDFGNIRVDGGYFWTLTNGAQQPSTVCPAGAPMSCDNPNDAIQTISLADYTLTEDGGVNARSFEAFGTGNNSQPIFIGISEPGNQEYIYADDGGDMASNGSLTNSVDIGGTVGIQCVTGGIHGTPTCNDTNAFPLATVSEYDGGLVTSKTTAKVGTFQSSVTTTTITFADAFSAVPYFCECHSKVALDCEPTSAASVVVPTSATAGWWMCVGPE